MALGSTAVEIASFWWVVHSGLSLWKAVRARRLYLAHRKWMDRTIPETPQKNVALIIATKGISENYERFLDFILTQKYRNYRVIFVTESEVDPAFDAISKRLESHDDKPRVELLVAGLSDRTGQKVHNLRVALSTLEDGDEILAFADADLYGRNDWLSCLTQPVNTGQCEFTTGYRWFLPVNRRLPNRIIGSLGIAMESWISSGWRMLLWGGSMTVTRETFDELDIYKNLDRCLNDDVRITELAQASKKKIRYVRSAEATTPVDYSFPELFEFGRRQYMCLRLHRKRMLFCAILFPFLYLTSFVICVLLLFQGILWMLVLIGLVFLFNVLRQHIRNKYVSERFSDPDRKKLLSTISSSWWIDPIEKLVNLPIAVSAAFAKKMTWGGIRYRIHGPRSIEINGRGTSPH